MIELNAAEVGCLTAMLRAAIATPIHTKWAGWLRESAGAPLVVELTPSETRDTFTMAKGLRKARSMDSILRTKLMKATEE